MLNAVPTVSQPVIEVQPINVIISAGGTATLTVVASGHGLSYQWFGPNGEALSDSAGVIGGSTTATLDIFNAQRDDAGDYFVRVSNAAGRVESEGAELLIGEFALFMQRNIECSTCRFTTHSV